MSIIGQIHYKYKKHGRVLLKMRLLDFKKTRLLNHALDASRKRDNVVISFTTIASRLEVLPYTLMSLLDGTVLAENILLYVGTKEYEIIKNLDNSNFITKLIGTGYLIVKEVEDVRCYTKLIYALEDYPKKDVVVCDDDIYYPKYWLSELLQAKTNQNTNIICHRAHYALTENEELIEYSKWEHEIGDNYNNKSFRIFPTGTGGVLFPPNSLSELVFDKSAFKKHSPFNDDVWFWFCAIDKGTLFTVTSRKYKTRDFLELPDSQKQNLYSLNVHGNRNDKQIKSSFNFFVDHNPLVKSRILNS